jgi:hypothetical protein
MDQTQERYYIYKDDQREMVGYPSLGQASAEWIQDPVGKTVVQEDSEGHILREYSKDECRMAAQDFMHGGSNTSD